MASKAKVSYVRIPPRKARLVADLVRGKDANAATAILQYTTHKSAKVMEKLLKSAISNAVSRGNVDVDTLFIREITVDNGPILKRFTSRAMGRGTRVNKRTSHITMVLDER